MLHFVYSLCYRLALPFALLYLWWQTRRNNSRNENWQQRLGLVPRLEEPAIWVHAVSVGETIAAAPLVKALLAKRPDVPVLVTAMTATGAAQARKLFGDRVRYAYAPFDTPGSVRRFVQRVRPRALIILETELWPNLIAETHRQRCPIFLVNARLSERSARRYRKIADWIRSLLARLEWIAAQAEEDATRFIDIGALPALVSVTGSIKFDVVVTETAREQAQTLKQLCGGRPVWIAASTHDGEDDQLLAAHARILEHAPDALLILVPRHPDRFDPVAALVRERGFSCVRRSSGMPVGTAQVYLGDTMGELMPMFGAADVAFVGGSLIERGGHNPLEPAAWGLPVVTGPHVFNFETVYRQLDNGRGLIRIEDAGSLAEQVLWLLGHREQAREMGRSALAVVEANRGALERVTDGILERLAPAGDAGVAESQRR